MENHIDRVKERFEMSDFELFVELVELQSIKLSRQNEEIRLLRRKVTLLEELLQLEREKKGEE